MHATTPDAHGIFAAAMVRALTLALISKGVIGKAEMLDICATARKSLGDSGVRHDSDAETDAALLAASLSAEIESRF